jgi:hypothetical protein
VGAATTAQIAPAIRVQRVGSRATTTHGARRHLEEARQMYKAIARRKARGVFEALSRGEWEATLKDVAPDVHHVFPGDNAIGGERHSKEAMRRWFERL